VVVAVAIAATAAATVANAAAAGKLLASSQLATPNNLI